MSVASARPLRLLVLDAYAPDGRQELRDGGCTEAGALYARVLRELAPGARIDVLYAADGEAALPPGAALEGYDGAVWTGSSLTIHREGDARVTRQVEWARALLDAGVPGFGSCWAAQLATVATGGRCAASPRGREFGVSRKIELSAEGRAHPLYAGKPAVFDAFTSHADEIVELPAGAALLASNRWSRVQALEVGRGESRFWAVQYHPEYDLREIARLGRVRAAWLVEQGSFRDPAAVGDWADRLEALHDDPTRTDLAYGLGLDEDVLDPAVRLREVSNWLAHVVAARAAARD
ncbi:MAG: type 1 glutamine amidotransferase [Myxococcota bacterium]|nr:type 1 glutamine amidotransferase [Myxococcota bacterium]